MLDKFIKQIAIRNYFGQFLSPMILLALITFTTQINALAQCCALPPAGLISWYAAEGDASDQLGNNPGTLNGGTFLLGEVGQAFKFNGISDYVSAPASQSLNVGAGSGFTFECWIKPISVSALQGLQGWSGGTETQVMLNPMGSMAAIVINLFDSVGIVHQVSSAGIVTTNNFQHVAVSYDKTSGTAKIYYNGQLVTSQNVGSVTPLTTGGMSLGRSDLFSAAYYYGGLMDEACIYSRALADSEILTIYTAGTAGKCGTVLPTPSAPVIISQPIDQFTTVGNTILVSVVATNCFLNYQWFFDTTNLINGATNATLTLTNVQISMSGNYSVIVSNSAGLVISSNALLTVDVGCISLPGLLSWWKGDSNTLDEVGSNNGALSGNSTYASGEVGQAFSFDGNAGSGISLGNCTNLQVQDLTFEAWIQRGSLSIVGHDAGGAGILFGFGTGGYSIYMDSAGHLNLAKLNINNVVSPGVAINDLNYHHIAVTKSGTNVVFYVDGVASSAVNYNVTFTFTTPAAIGAQGGSRTISFFGKIDEAAIYNRALSVSEIQSIYTAGTLGKCDHAPPIIVTQPVDCEAIVGENAVFSISANSREPLYYQWKLNATNIIGATNSILNLTNVQLSEAGNYSITVSSINGSTNSRTAILTVDLPPTCTAIPSGLIGWWKGESNALDKVGGNTGTLLGNTTYSSGRVGQAFSFDGNAGSGISLGACANLQVQDLTFEAWIQRGSLSTVGYDSGGSGILFGFGAGGYSIYMDSGGHLNFAKLNVNNVVSPDVAITNLNFHHVAVTKSGTNVIFYMDGVASSVVNYNVTFTFATPAAIGAQGGSQTISFLGKIDEVSIYNRALGANEIQSIYAAQNGGKCIPSGPPSISFQPQSNQIYLGSNALFSVSVQGGFPLSYQWQKNNTNIANATNSFLSLNNAQSSDAGIYSVIVSNQSGTVTSSNAMLSVNLVKAIANSNQILTTDGQYSFSGATIIELSNIIGAGYIFYTLDGSTPTFGSTQYTVPFTITQNSIIKALGYSSDFSQSAITGPISITILPVYLLTTYTAGGGKIIVTPPSSPYPAYTNVTISAMPSNGWTFLGWQGDAGGTNRTSTVLMSRDKSVQAIFGTTVSHTPTSGGSIVFNPPGGIYPYGTTLQVIAVPQTGNQFALWGSSASGAVNPLSFAVTNANPTISALFGSLPDGQVSLAVMPLGHGKVTVNPQSNNYPVGQSVTLTAVPDAGKNFLSWSGNATGDQNPLMFNLAQSEVIYANFTTNHTLDLTLGPGTNNSEGVELDLNGELGTHYRLDGSTNLIDWAPLLDFTNAVGTLHFIDTNAINLNYRFYRAVVLP